MTWFDSFLVAFVKIAIAVDIPGILPIYLALVDTYRSDQRRKVIKVGLLTSSLAGLLFLFLGRAILNVLGITLIDFQLGGGLILVIIGVRELLGGDTSIRQPAESVGIVPIGVPLILGPAVISVMVISIDQHGLGPTLLAFFANMALVGVVFQYAALITRLLGGNGVKAASKIIMILLVALGVKMIRTGVLTTLARHL
jgi:multiple antibiotic resistance protein